MHDSRPVAIARPSERITLTNEVELERARLQCLRPSERIMRELVRRRIVVLRGGAETRDTRK